VSKDLSTVPGRIKTSPSRLGKNLKILSRGEKSRMGKISKHFRQVGKFQTTVEGWD
jgi:hypothetical protein